jgi:hypothetical protein
LRAFALLIALVVAVPLVAARFGTSTSDASSFPIGKDGTFYAQCAFTRSAGDDPIVYPRAPGYSHMHTFMGAKVGAFSTNKSIRKAATRCDRPGVKSGSTKTADHSGYWAPAVYDGNTLIPPMAPGAGALYFPGMRDYRKIRAFPKNLRMIAGSAQGKLTTKSSVARVYRWSCGGAQLAPPLGPGKAPLCQNYLQVNIRFPDCWDGVHSDSRDHRSHMAYSDQASSGSPRWVCPADHPVLVPMLELEIRYQTHGGPTIQLASGDLRTTHADFMNGWNQSQLKKLIKRCLNKDLYCGGTDYPVPGHH